MAGLAGQRGDYGKGLHSLPEHSTDEGDKRRNPNEDRETNGIGPDDTVYRYLCPVRRIGIIMGIGGEIAKMLRAETHAKIRISETIPGCEERVVTIYSSSEETSCFGDDDHDLISAAQDALFKVHERVIAEESQLGNDLEEPCRLTVRLLVPSDQIGCVIGRGGQVVQGIRNETGAHVRILSSEHLPPCALASDELVQISGEIYAVKQALFRVSSCLHENPSRSQHLLLSSASIYRSGSLFSPITSSVGGGYRASRNSGGNKPSAVKEFSLRLVCPTESIGAVIGKGGSVIKQIRQESGASVKIDTSDTDGGECIIFVSAKETFKDASTAIDATMRLQPRCSQKNEKDFDDPTITTRLLVPCSRIGCLIGKGGAIINEMRSITKATIRILSEENLPKVAAAEDEMVQITGDPSVASSALLQVLLRLRANLFDMEGALLAVPSALPFVPPSLDTADGPRHSGRDMRSRSHGYSSHSGVHNSGNSLQSNIYPVPIGGRNEYASHTVYSAGPSSTWGLPAQNAISHGRSYGH